MLGTACVPPPTLAAIIAATVPPQSHQHTCHARSEACVARAGAARQLPGIREKTVPMACPGKQPDHRFDILTSQILRVLAFQAMVAIIAMRRHVTRDSALAYF
jgi:hypothetical protein